MVILQSQIFRNFPELIFGLSTKIDDKMKPPYFFNLSFSVEDESHIVHSNRKKFIQALRLEEEQVAFQRQIHSDIIKHVTDGGDHGQSDALITNCKGLALSVSIADCTPIFIYDRKKESIAAIHSGWRGTLQQITVKTINQMNQLYGSDPEDMVAYIGPSIYYKDYEVGGEVACQFNGKYVHSIDGSLYLDVSGINYDYLLDCGVPARNIQYSALCTFQLKQLLHSYRRDGLRSGRQMGIIAMKRA